MELSVSLSTFVAACFGFLGVYVLMPFALILRDFLLIKFINIFLLNEDFWRYLRVLESDRAHCNYFFNKSMQITHKLGGHPPEYMIDGKSVTEEEFQKFDSEWKFHIGRMDEMWKKIEIKNNIAIKMFKYFKLDEYEGLIEKKSKEMYDSALVFIKNKEAVQETII